MTRVWYHGRRLAVSYAYEYGLRGLSALLTVPKRFHLVLYFACASLGAGLAFTVFPAAMAGYFGFEHLNLTALTDVRAYYGTMLVALGIGLLVMAQTLQGARAALVVIVAFSLGSATGRLIGFLQGEPIGGIHGVLFPVEVFIGFLAANGYRKSGVVRNPERPVLHPKTPEDFRPLSQANFENPYAFYKMLRDHCPVYRMEKQGFYMISRYQDICDLTKDTELMSNKLVEILAGGKPKPLDRKTRSPIEVLGDYGVIPVDVMALQDPPIHTEERKIGHKGFNAKFIKSLETEVENLCDEMMDPFIDEGYVEFIQDFAWRLPMRLIIRLLAFPEQDFEHIKAWCVDGIRSLSGIATPAEMMGIGASGAQFMRYIWKHYLKIKKHPDDSFTALLAREAEDPESIMTDQRAVATLLQLLIAGSDSSASSMGSAIRVLADNPDIEKDLRRDPELIPLFIEEVFRTESAFQGHFRLTKKSCEVHGVAIPANSRVFMMWGSGNRDERFWDDPETFNFRRDKVKKHLTFGHGIHACIGRELARMEIRIVIAKLLEKTSAITIVGPTPYEASIFARTLTRLPLAFEKSR